MPRVGEIVPFTIGVVGSRRRDSDEDFRICRIAVLHYFHLKPQERERVRLISGGCQQGGDRFAEILAKSIGLSIVTHYPKFWLYGSPKALFERNTLIARDCSILLALPAGDHTGGTEDTIRKAEAFGKDVILL